MLGEQVEGATHAGQHAKGEDVHLHELQDVDVILVPLDDLAIFHGRRLDRHQLIQPVAGQHEPTRVLREMARRADKLVRELKRQAQSPVTHVEVEALGVSRLDAFAPAPDLRRQRLGQVFGQAERLADIAKRALGPVADDGGAKCRAIAAIAFIDPLDDFFAPLMLEIDIDVGRLAPLLGDEALEQKVVAIRID